MENVLGEAARVARRAVVVVFYVPPEPGRPRQSHRVGDNFIETRWTESDVLTPLERSGWRVRERFAQIGEAGGQEAIWVVQPTQAETHTVTEQFKFSVIMPTYRRAHTIRRAVASIQAQTHRNWELIVIDNAGDAPEGFDDPRIRVYRHAERASASYARNWGLSYATGDLVCFFDDDDEMFPGYLRRFAEVFEQQPGAQMVRCGMLLTEGQVNFSYATPQCCLRRASATPTWTDRNTSHDQIYFKSIAAVNGWSEVGGQIVSLAEAQCRIHYDPYGGLRAGRL
jgi:hypothetical protein